MRQLLQYMNTGETVIVDAPAPRVAEGCLLIQTTNSLISAGTERMLVGFGKASYIQKARQQPEKVKMVLDKMRTDGLVSTIGAVRSKLSEPLPLGYCNVGMVLEVGKDVKGFRVGDMVVSNGPHADIVNVPKHLCALVPENVEAESAAFTVIGSIALQGIRLSNSMFGEVFAVIGVGLIGLLTVQLLRANGCRVLAIDFDESKLELARRFGAMTCNPGNGENPVDVGMSFSRGRGIDAVIITASTKSSDPVTQAAQMCRKRGRIVLVGVTGLELNRADFYEKELTFQVSCSYGPGRYDPEYENLGHDYPIGFVRWTEQRNFEAMLDIMSSGQVDIQALITHRFAFEDAISAYDLLSKDKSALGILLSYTSDSKERNVNKLSLRNNVKFKLGEPVIGCIGAGNYASRILIPAFKAAGAQLHTIVSAGGTSAVVHGKKAGFETFTTDLNVLLENEVINVVAIVTRHDTHADLTVQALNAGKHVFVEKPLSIDLGGLRAIESAYRAAWDAGRYLHLMVGFNRRFSPLITRMKLLLDSIHQPKSFIMTVNAGEIPATHWTQNTKIGGGRIIGEACHFVDLMRYLAGSEILSSQACCMMNGIGTSDDKAMIFLRFADGSVGAIHYLANGSSSFPKERLEVFTAGRVLQLNNFRKMVGYGWPNFKKMSLWSQNKGQRECVKAFLNAIENGKSTPIPFGELLEVSRVTLEIAEQLRNQ